MSMRGMKKIWWFDSHCIAHTKYSFMNVEPVHVDIPDSFAYSVIANHAIDDHAFMMMKEVTIGILLGITLFLVLFAREIMHTVRSMMERVRCVKVDNACQQTTKVMPWIGSSGIMTSVIRNATVFYMVAILVVINIFGEQLRLHLFSDVVASVIYVQRIGR